METVIFDIYRCLPDRSHVCIPMIDLLTFVFYPLLACIATIPAITREFKFYSKNKFDFKLDSGFYVFGSDRINNTNIPIGVHKLATLIGLFAGACGVLVYIVSVIYAMNS